MHVYVYAFVYARLIVCLFVCVLTVNVRVYQYCIDHLFLIMIKFLSIYFCRCVFMCVCVLLYGCRFMCMFVCVHVCKHTTYKYAQSRLFACSCICSRSFFCFYKGCGCSKFCWKYFAYIIVILLIGEL